MTWSLAFPNLLVGLREGLEAGLVVTILISSVRRLAPGRPLAPVWIGVAAAAVLSLSFGAVLTFTSTELSPKAQEVFGGVLSLVTVVLVTSMIFWMRRAAKSMSGEIRGRVGDALASGGLALVITAFVSVAREGLEAALFVWTNAQAAGSSTSPLLGALIGLLIATALCTGLYRRVVKLNLTRFFTITGAALIVVVAGIAAYAVTDLQDAGVLPGLNATAFDVSGALPTGRWWSETIRGITNLNNVMSWAQVVAYVGYLAVVMTAFLWPSRTATPSAATAPTPPTPVAETAEPPAPESPAAEPATPPVAEPATPPVAEPAAEPSVGRARRRGRLAVAALAVPVVAAVAWVAVDYHGSTASAGAAVTVTDHECAAGWGTPRAGSVTYSVANRSSSAVDVEIVTEPAGDVAAEIEVLGPGTTRSLPVTLAASPYRWKCVFAGAATLTSASRTPVGRSSGTVALAPTTAAELAPALATYRRYVSGQLAALATQVAALDRDVAAGQRPQAERDWLTALLTYHRVGAAYNAFGDDGAAIDGLSSGLPLGVRDPGFVGLHRIEYELWHGTALTRIRPYTAALVRAVGRLRTDLPKFVFDPNDVTIRAHEIVEDTIRFVLTGQSDYGCGCGYATAEADLAGDRAVVAAFRAPILQRSPGLPARIAAAQDQLARLLTPAVASRTPVLRTPASVAAPIAGATSALAETLAPIPDLLEVRAP